MLAGESVAARDGVKVYKNLKDGDYGVSCNYGNGEVETLLFKVKQKQVVFLGFRLLRLVDIYSFVYDLSVVFRTSFNLQKSVIGVSRYSKYYGLLSLRKLILGRNICHQYL